MKFGRARSPLLDGFTTSPDRTPWVGDDVIDPEHGSLPSARGALALAEVAVRDRSSLRTQVTGNLA